MSIPRDRSKETRSEEIQSKRKTTEVEFPRKEFAAADVVLPLGVEAQALTDPRFSSRANNGRKLQVVLRLQRTYGNALIQRLLSNGALRRQEGNFLSSDMVQRINAARGGGQPLAHETRLEMEAALGQDLAGVRVHANSEANGLAKELGAKAFTIGQDVFFGAGIYTPESEAGRETLAHELAHVVQQSRAGEGQPSVLSQPTDAAEVEAQEVGAQLASSSAQMRVPVEESASAGTIQRNPDGGDFSDLEAQFESEVIPSIAAASDALFSAPSRGSLTKARSSLLSSQSNLVSIAATATERSHFHLAAAASGLSSHLGAAVGILDVMLGNPKTPLELGEALDPDSGATQGMIGKVWDAFASPPVAVEGGAEAETPVPATGGM